MNTPRGRPFPPGNTAGRGRPKGSRNKATMVAQQLLDQHSEPIVRKCIIEAMHGNVHALKLCMERLTPARREHTYTAETAASGNGRRCGDGPRKRPTSDRLREKYTAWKGRALPIHWKRGARGSKQSSCSSAWSNWSAMPKSVRSGIRPDREASQRGPKRDHSEPESSH